MGKTTIETKPLVEALSSTATLFRMGAMRILVLNDYTLNENIVLAEGDRPVTAINSPLWANTSSGIYFKGGNTNLNEAGIIKAYATTSYNAATAQIVLDDTEKIKSTLIWSVV